MSTGMDTCSFWVRMGPIVFSFSAIGYWALLLLFREGLFLSVTVAVMPFI